MKPAVLLVLLTLLFGGVDPAFAASLTSPETEVLVLPSRFGFVDVPAENPVAISAIIDPFDPELGELVSVSLLFGGSGSPHFILSDLTPGVYDWSERAELSMFGPEDSLLASGAASLGGGSIVVLETGEVEPERFWTDVPFEADIFDGNAFMDTMLVTSNLDLFLEPNTYSLSAELFMRITGPDFPGSPVVPADFYIGLLGTGTGGSIRYTYVPGGSIPEPESYVLFLAGVLVVGLGIRRSAVADRG